MPGRGERLCCCCPEVLARQCFPQVCGRSGLVFSLGFPMRTCTPSLPTFPDTLHTDPTPQSSQPPCTAPDYHPELTATWSRERNTFYCSQGRFPLFSSVRLVWCEKETLQTWGLKCELGEHHTLQTKKLTFRLPPAHGHRKIFQRSHKQISALFFLL